MNSKPTVSVVMAVHNGYPYLSDALNSIGAQTFTDYEFIIVNDGSTDETEEILDCCRRADPRVKIFSIDHSGLVTALNLGCRFAKGEFIARIDADDVSTPDRLERQIEFLRLNKRVAVLGGVVGTMFKDGVRSNDNSISSSEPLTDADIRIVLKSNNCIPHSTVMMRTSSFHEAGGYRNAFPEAQDYDLWLRMSEKYELAKLPAVLTYYRIHCGQVSIRRVKQQVISALAAQTAFRLRHAIGTDSISNEDRATRHWLNKHGVADDVINRRIITGYLNIISPAQKYLLRFPEDKTFIADLAIEALTFCDTLDSSDDQVRRLKSLAVGLATAGR